jgi:hypothetical protein
MKLVGSEGTHWRAFPKEGCCCCVATAIVDCCGKGDSGGDRGVSCYVDM